MHLNHTTFKENVFELKSADEGGDEHANEIVTKALADLTASVENRLKAMETKSDKLEAKLNRPNLGGRAEASPAEIETKAFDHFLRTGDATELKALTTTTGTTGVMMPPTLSTTILERVKERSPIRALATSISMTGPMLSIPVLETDATVSTVPEVGQRPTTEPSFKQIDVKTFEMATFVPMSVMALEDANVDLGAFVSNHLVRIFGDTENRWFIKGNGTTQPEGVLLNPDIKSITTTQAGMLHNTDLIDLFYSVSATYRAKGAWLMNSSSLAQLRSLKASDDGDWLFDSRRAGQPDTLFGRPVYEVEDMPNIDAPSECPIIFGDFETAYLIADRVNFEPVRDDDPRNGLVYLGGRRRVGGRVIMPEALKKLRNKAV